MKCLSLWQPWTSLLAHGLKRAETRGWPIRHRGPLLIHAAKTWNRELETICDTEPFAAALEANIATSETWRPRTGLPFGCIVGSVEITECIATTRVGRWEQDSREPMVDYFFDNFGIMGPADGKPFLFVSDTERSFGDYSPGRFAFLCTNPVAFATPITYRGAQGLFDVPDSLLPKDC